MTTLSEFIGFVKQNGVAKTNRFRLTFNLPQAVITRMASELGTSANDGTSRTGYSQSANFVGSSTQAAYALSLMCQAVTLPGTTVSTQDMITQNSTRKIPFDKSYSDFECTFVSSGNMIEKKTFETWIGSMFNKDHTVAYFDDYTVDILVEVLNESNWVIYTYKLTECYPSAIMPLTLDRSATNQFQTFGVSFHFTKPKRVEDEFGTRRSALNVYAQPGLVVNGPTAMRLPNGPDMVGMSLAAIDVYKSIDRIKQQVNNGLHRRDAQVMFRGILREVDGIETLSSFEHGALTGYINDISITLNRG